MAQNICAIISASEDFGIDDLFLQVDICLNTREDEFIKNTIHSVQPLIAVVSITYNLRDHGIVEGNNTVPPIEKTVDTYSVTARRKIVCDFSRRVGVDTAFNGIALELYVVLFYGEFFSTGHVYLFPDNVHTGYQLGDRMLDLYPCVHLHEVVFPSCHQEFDGSGAAVLQSLEETHRVFPHAFTHFRRNNGGGAFLYEFLVILLTGTVAFPEVYYISLTVPDNLYFHVPGIFKVLLKVHRAVIEGSQGPQMKRP